MDEIRQAGMAIARLEKAGEFEIAQQRIRDEANRKRAEAAKGHEFRGNQHVETNEVVVPQPEGQPAKNEPDQDPKPARDHTKKHAQSSATAKAKAIGTSRANVERAEAIHPHPARPVRAFLCLAMGGPCAIRYIKLASYPALARPTRMPKPFQNLCSTCAQ